MQELMVSPTHNLDYYESINEVFDVPITNERNQSLYQVDVLGIHKRERYSYLEDWFGKGGGWPEVEPLMTKGWAEGMERMKKLAESLEDQIIIPLSDELRPRVVHRDFGDEVDMQDIYMGDYDHAWSGIERVTTKVDTRFTVVVNVGASVNTSANAMYWPGAVATVLSNMLIKSRQPVRVLAASTHLKLYSASNAAGLEDFSAAVEIKGFKTPIVPDAIALTALAAFFRGCMFKACYNQVYEVNRNIGYPRSIERAIHNALKLPKQDHTLFIGQVRSEYQAVEELKRKLRDIENFVGVK